MKTIHLFIGFIIIALVQIFIPAKMIWDNEDTLVSGTEYKFKTRPIDPTDPFRGKYITLQYEINSFAISDSDLKPGDRIRVYLEKDENGFAKVIRVSKKTLDINNDFVMAKVTSNYQNMVYFQLPFDRFYMDETKAYDAEKAYRETNRDSLRKNVYALVYVKNDQAVLKDVIIDGISIQDYVEK